MNMITVEDLNRIQIRQSNINGHIYIGMVTNDGYFVIDSDFTDRLKEFAPQLFEEKLIVRDTKELMKSMTHFQDILENGHGLTEETKHELWKIHADLARMIEGSDDGD